MWPPTFNCTWGGSPPPLSPPLQFLTRHRSGEAGGVCRFVKTLKSGVCTICAALLVWDRRKLNQESIVFRDCFSRNNNLVPYVINHLFPPLVPPLLFSQLSTPFSSPLFTSLLTRPPSPLLPSTPQVLLESALKHWSRVKRYVAQDGSG